MSKFEKLIRKILSGASDNNIEFEALRSLLIKLGFNERIKGSHHIYSKEGVEEIINLQQSVSGKAKPYQVKQVRTLLIEYKLTEEK